MIYTAKELLLKLTHLTLTVDDKGIVLWIGTKEQWDLCQ